jgi:hypothetical protein
MMAGLGRVTGIKQAIEAGQSTPRVGRFPGGYIGRMQTLRVLAAAVAIVALAVGPSGAQQTPGDNGTDANGPITILKNMQAEPDGVAVWVDGQNVEDLHTADYSDITGVVHRGQNTLTIRWSAPLQKLYFKIAYAPTRNNFKTVLLVQSDASRDAALRRAGARTYTFAIPG